MKRVKVHKSDEYIKLKPEFKKLYLTKYKWPKQFDEAKTADELVKAIRLVNSDAWNEFKYRAGGDFMQYLMRRWRNRLGDKFKALGKGDGWVKRYKIGKKRLTPGIADKIKKLEAAQSRSDNCMKYVMREARESFKGLGLEEKEKLRKLWATSIKKAFQSIKDSKAGGKLKCHFGRNNN